MPTSAAGNKPGCWPPAAKPARGFTLIELMVVVTLIAIATASVGLALRGGADSALERDAQRLAAVLEAARAQARASESRVVWQLQEGGFVLQGLPRPSPFQPWLSPQTRAEVVAPVVLGPEPLIAPQRIGLYTADHPAAPMWVVSDGLRPFEVQRHAGTEGKP